MNTNINTNLNNLGEKLIEKKVADAKSFLENTVFNLNLVYLSKNLVSSGFNEFRKRHPVRKKTESGKYRLETKDLHVEILNQSIELNVLISKNFNDTIQYASNTLDSLAQLVNCALIYPSESIDDIDFTWLRNVFNNPNKKIKKNGNLIQRRIPITKCIKVKSEFNNIANSDIYKYLKAATNRTKHISNINKDLSYLPLDKKVIGNVAAFTKNTNLFAKADIVSKCEDIYNFIEESVDDVCKAISLDLETVSLKYRYNCIEAIAKCTDEVKGDLDYLIAYVDIQLSNNENLPKEIELIGINDNLELFNYDLDCILLRINGTFKGYATIDTSKNSNDIITYAKYNTYYDNGEKFSELKANHTKMKCQKCNLHLN